MQSLNLTLTQPDNEGRTARITSADLERFLNANSTRQDVREVNFRRPRAIAQRNPDVDGGALLEELERLDKELQLLGTHRGVKIVSPTAFLDLLTARQRD